MSLSRLPALLLLLGLSLALIGCDLREGTIVYDVDYPKADEVPTGGSGTGGSGGGGGSGTTGSGSGSGGYDPDNSSIGYTITESGGSTDVVEGATDTFDIVLNSAPTDNTPSPSLLPIPEISSSPVVVVLSLLTIRLSHSPSPQVTGTPLRV